jgi:hypothetical protein
VYAALIRGSIAFGLILKMDDDFQGHILPAGVKKEDFHDFYVFKQGQVEVIQSTTSALVIITTIVYGAFTNLAQKLLLTNNGTSHGHQKAYRNSINEEATEALNEHGAEDLRESDAS